MKNHRGGGIAVGPPQQRPLEMAMLSATISLPDEFLCDSGYLYDSIIIRAPGAVVREAFESIRGDLFLIVCRPNQLSFKPAQSREKDR
jgi:hypothetical protein